MSSQKVLEAKIRAAGESHIGVLASLYDNEHASWDKKTTAQVAYVLMVAFARCSSSVGKTTDAGKEWEEKAKRYGRDCMHLLRELPRNTVEQAASHFSTLAGVQLPNYFYFEYVIIRCRELRELGLV